MILLMLQVTALPPNDKGFHDVFGNCWDWTSDYFSPLTGFEVHKYYEDFSTPCFDGLHHVIMGGSFISTGNEASIFSRYHFRPHFFQHASFRIAEVIISQINEHSNILRYILSRTPHQLTLTPHQYTFSHTLSHTPSTHSHTLSHALTPHRIWTPKRPCLPPTHPLTPIHPLTHPHLRTPPLTHPIINTLSRCWIL